jgi:hypothetical protein
MEIPPYFLPSPQLSLNREKKAAFDDLWRSTPPGDLIDYRLPHPKWEFLTDICRTNELVLHGSQRQDIEIVEPQQARDKREFSNQRAIYATTDGIWVVFFAIIDRKHYSELSLFNSCFQVYQDASHLSDPYYFFSITQTVKLQQPWCNGMVYILPRHGFYREPVQKLSGVEVIFPHWISDQPARPAARIIVGPQDFPYMDQIHGHDDEKLIELFTKNPGGFPIEAVVS